MNGTFRRQTFIALRARREGYRIASEILNHPVRIDVPPVRAPDETYKRTIRTQRWFKRDRLYAQKRFHRQLLKMILVGVLVMLGIAACIVVYLLRTGTARLAL